MLLHIGFNSQYLENRILEFSQFLILILTKNKKRAIFGIQILIDSTVAQW